MALSRSSPSSHTTSSLTTTSHPQQTTIVSPILGPSALKHHQQPFDTALSATATSPVTEPTTGRTAPSLLDTAATGSSPNDTLSRQSNNYKHRQSTLSTSSSKQNRTGLFTLAVLARDKTTNAIASLSEPTIRSRPSSSSLYRSAQSSPTTSSNTSIGPSRSTDSQTSSRENTEHSRTSSSNTSASPSSHSRTETQYSTSTQRQSLLETNPPSQAYADTAADTPPPIAFIPQGNYNKMHQTSSRLLRMTSDDRPFTRVSIVGGEARGQLG